MSTEPQATPEPTVEQVALEQRATDPRLEQANEPAATEETPTEPVAQEPTEQPPPPAKPKKTAEEVLKGRVGHLTKTLSTKDQELTQRQQELEEYKAKLAAAEALLNSSGQPAAPNIAPPGTPPVANGNKTYTEADFEAAVKQQTEVQEFNRRADEMYNQGAEKFTDWKDSVDTLVAAGFMNKDLLDAAMAIEDGPTVLHHLGANLDEAERIAALPPIKKAAEMAKLSNVLTAPRTVPVSSAPAPIKPVAGSPTPQVDLQRIADDNDMKAYAAARAKQGSRWATGRR